MGWLAALRGLWSSPAVTCESRLALNRGQNTLNQSSPGMGTTNWERFYQGFYQDWLKYEGERTLGVVSLTSPFQRARGRSLGREPAFSVKQGQPSACPRLP